MLIAGYETTSTLLGFFSYEMALNTDSQRKLQEEIDSHFDEHVSTGFHFVIVDLFSDLNF